MTSEDCSMASCSFGLISASVTSSAEGVFSFIGRGTASLGTIAWNRMSVVKGMRRKASFFKSAHAYTPALGERATSSSDPRRLFSNSLAKASRLCATVSIICIAFKTYVSVIAVCCAAREVLILQN